MHTFFISAPNTGGSMVSRDPQETSKRFPESWTIPSVELVADKRPGKVGMTYIAAVPGESSAYVDEQSNKDLIKDLREGKVKVPRLTFSEGRRNVQETSVSEYEFLKLTKFNRENKAGGLSRTFFEYKPQEMSKLSVERELNDIRIKSAIMALDMNKLKAVARVSDAVKDSKAFDSVDPSIIQHSLIVKVKTEQGKALIDELLKDPILEYRYDIHEAIDNKILRWHPTNPYSLIWTSGGQVCNVPAGTDDKVKHVAEFLMTNGYETLNTIRKLMGRVSITETIEETESVDIKEWIKSAGKEEIIDKILDWNKANPELAFLKFKGPYMHFEDIKLSTEKVPKGRDGAKDFLIGDDTTFQEVYKIWVKYVL
jgi:hypothetical protein